MPVFSARRIAFGVLPGIVALALPAAGQAQVTVFDNGVPDYVSNYVSAPNDIQYIADDFTFTSRTSFNQIVWYGLYGVYDNSIPSTADAFTITLHNTTAGVPNAAAFMTLNVGSATVRTSTGERTSTFRFISIPTP